MTLGLSDDLQEMWDSWKTAVINRKVMQACGYRYGYNNQICSRQWRVGFRFGKYRYVSPRIHHECFPTSMTDRDPVYYTLFFSRFCLQMTNNCLSISSRIPVKAILRDFFLI